MMQTAVKTKKPRKQAVSGRFWAMRTYRGRIKDDHKIDPCMGSGHILVYLFDVLMQIYESQGWTQREAAQSIVQNNLFGLDIDERAAQLAYFAVMMKARQYDRRFLTRGIVPHVYDIRETNDLNPDYLQLFGDLQKKAQTLFDELRDAKTYGSILKLSLTEQDLAALRERLNEIRGKEYDNFFDSARRDGLLYDFPPLLDETFAMVQKYDVVVTNPPYMGASSMGATLSQYVKDNYPDSKSDLFAVFIEQCCSMTDFNGYQSMITQHVWMFLSSFEKLRAKLQAVDTVNMAHLGARAFEEIGGEVVQTTSFVLRRNHLKHYTGTYCRLIEPTTQQGKEDMFLAGKNHFYAQQDDFKKIPGAPVAYWVSELVYDSFKNTLSDVASTKQGFKTGDNDTFLRFWFETSKQNTTFQADRTKKWFPCTKGGEFRRWYGNLEYVVNWENDGYDIKHFFDDKGKLRSRPQNLHINFTKELSWSSISSGPISFRYSEDYLMYESKGPVLTPSGSFEEMLAYLNSKVYQYFIQIIAPTLDYSEGAVLRAPYKKLGINVDQLVNNCISISRSDWDSFETSWNFKRHPLLPLFADAPGEFTTIEMWYRMWEDQCQRRFDKLKSNEEELNRIFIEIYGLQDELTPEIEDKDVTVRRADLQRDIKSLLSYAVGCMFGRYSLDRPGLVFAGGDFNSIYWRFKGQAALDKAGEPIYGGYAGISMASYHYPRFKDAADYREATRLKYEPDADNCIPITDEAYFEDDIVGRFVEFVRIVYGEKTLEENLSFIAKALGNKGNSSREVIRNYFLNDFIKDHIKIYQKHPIYWLFDSGKQNGFKALVYMHRWDADTVGNLRVEYLHRMQRVYEKEIERMQDIMDNSHDNREINQAAKRREKLVKQLKETRDYDAKIAHVALSRVEIDLDDGVKANYEKVQKGPDGKSLNILAKI